MLKMASQKVAKRYQKCSQNHQNCYPKNGRKINNLPKRFGLEICSQKGGPTSVTTPQKAVSFGAFFQASLRTPKKLGLETYFERLELHFRRFGHRFWQLFEETYGKIYVEFAFWLFKGWMQVPSSKRGRRCPPKGDSIKYNPLGGLWANNAQS